MSEFYDKIQAKIYALKDTYPSLRSKRDDYVFSALCVKSQFYKNPAYSLSDRDIEEMIVDGQYDGGVDVLLSDPNSDTDDLIIVQSKYYASISFDDVVNAMTKMASFYKDMMQGHFEQVNNKVHSRFLTLNAELGEESKVHFVFYTSALQSGINKSRVEKKFRDQFVDSSNLEVSILFGKDICEEINEAESRRPSVESGKITIDEADNVLYYGDYDAAIVNVSAYSIKRLYAQHSIQLLARNLRYHIKGKDIDKGIEETIKSSPDTFWFKNNGLTIICSDFDVDGIEVKLRNFSIVNGGQTTYMLQKSPYIDANNDLYLPCKIIKTVGSNEDERNDFSLSIAKATNTQKPIKPVDLKANATEQVRFANTMREVGLFYQTKRGENIPLAYKDEYLNSSLMEIGKLCLAGVFQIPCASRTKPSSLYNPQYYERIFNGNQTQIAKICKELLYMDYYFRRFFIKRFDRDAVSMPALNDRIAFAHNARTICIAFAAFASRYHQGNIEDQDINVISIAGRSENIAETTLYDVFSNLDNITHLLPTELFNNKNKYDAVLDKLFNLIIEKGFTSYSMASRFDASLTPTNYLKKDKNYYAILSDHWYSLKGELSSIFSDSM